jgi:hypothetical protein
MKAHSATTAAVVVCCLLVAGCADDGTLATNGLNTSSIEQKQAAERAEKNSAECMALTSQIETLHRDGAAAKVTKAASKKYKMKAADLAKADELNKANTEFQAKCSNYPPPNIAAVPEETPAPAAAATPAAAPAGTHHQAAAKSKPPMPAPKPVASALAPQASEAMVEPAPAGQP